MTKAQMTRRVNRLVRIMDYLAYQAKQTSDLDWALGAYRAIEVVRARKYATIREAWGE
jgi:hypothetical protein